MNIFVLSTGRCGSTTFAEACRHILNYTAAHESRAGKIGGERLKYPDNHIEVDNRLSWFLGRLDEKYGDDAFYVHLKRNREAVALSHKKRYNNRQSIFKAYTKSILLGPQKYQSRMRAGLDYCHTVNSNIELFLKDKSRKMDFTLENAEQDFEIFWNRIQAEGDLNTALGEWDVQHNQSNNIKDIMKRFLLLKG